jgi:hypothetical protein
MVSVHSGVSPRVPGYVPERSQSNECRARCGPAHGSCGLRRRWKHDYSGHVQSGDRHKPGRSRSRVERGMEEALCNFVGQGTIWRKRVILRMAGSGHFLWNEAPGIRSGRSQKTGPHSRVLRWLVPNSCYVQVVVFIKSQAAGLYRSRRNHAEHCYCGRDYNHLGRRRPGRSRGGRPLYNAPASARS